MRLKFKPYHCQPDTKAKWREWAPYAKQMAWGDRPVVRRSRSDVPTDSAGGPDAKQMAWGDRPVVGGREAMYRRIRPVGPTLNKWRFDGTFVLCRERRGGSGSG